MWLTNSEKTPPNGVQVSYNFGSVKQAYLLSGVDLLAIADGPLRPYPGASGRWRLPLRSAGR
jgi:hypothetical protein